MTPIMDKENPTIKANTTLGNLMFKNISDSKTFENGIEIEPKKGVINTESIPKANSNMINGFLIFK